MAAQKSRSGAAGGARAKATQGKTPTPAQKQFDKLSQKYFDWIMRQFPGTATNMGIHDYDSKLTNYTQAAVEARRLKAQEFHKTFKAISARGLDLESKIERNLIIDNLHVQNTMEKSWSLVECDPGSFLRDAVFSCYAITIRNCGDAEDAAQKMTSRLLEVPKLLQRGRKLIVNPTAINCEVAMMSGLGAISFFKDTVAKFAKRVKNANIRQSMREAAQSAEDAVESYLAWIEAELKPTASPEFAIGAELFDMKLAKEHQLDMNHEELLKLGKKVYRSTIKELTDMANKINPKYTWEELIEICKRTHPTNSELVQFYSEEMKRAKRFVIEHRLVDIPEGERIDVVPTPEFARSVIPYAAYIHPAPYEEEQRGTFWVTPVDRDKSPEEMEEQLRGHCTHGIVVTALHEAYPGHHLQLTVGNKLKARPIRMLLGSSVFIEGWALYCEQMMWEQGFYDDVRSRLLQLKDQLWRACRVILDVQLHTGGWSYQKGVNFLVEKAMLETPNAEAEVRRYCQTPTQPMSYIVGKMQVMELLEDYKVKRGPAFNLRQFHNEVISFGSLPVKSLRKMVNL